MPRTGGMDIGAHILGYGRLLAGFLCMVLLSSCNFVVMDTEGLLTPPTLNQKQHDVYTALKSTLNSTTEITFKYPQRGEYLSPFIFFDMDGDGRDEAIVFYSYNSDLSNTRTKILRQDAAGGWAPLQDISMSGSDTVDFVQFAKLLSADSYCMLIGWQSTMGQTSRVADSVLGVYSLAGDSFTTEVDQQPYISYTIQDFDGNGLEEIVTVEREQTLTLRISLLRPVDNHIDVVASLPLNDEADLLLQMVTGRLWDGSSAVYIDEVRIDGPTATEVIRVTSRGLEILAGGIPPLAEEPDPAWENYLYTYRDDQSLRCRDLDGDGIIEVPTDPIALPGDLEIGREDPLRLNQLMHMTAQGFSIRRSAVINEAEKYLVFFPDQWVGQVAVARDDDIDEWRFCLVDDEAGEQGAVLLRIRATAATQTAGPEEILLHTAGSRSYIGYIPRTTGDAPGITEAQLREMFLPL